MIRWPVIPVMSETTSVNLTFICSSAPSACWSVAGRIANLHLTLPMIGPQAKDRFWRPERQLQQTISVQPLDPLNVEHVGLEGERAA